MLKLKNVGDELISYRVRDPISGDVESYELPPGIEVEVMPYAFNYIPKQVAGIVKVESSSRPVAKSEDAPVLADVKGVGPSTLKKIEAAGIESVHELFVVEKDELKKIVGPIAAGVIYKDLHGE